MRQGAQILFMFFPPIYYAFPGSASSLALHPLAGCPNILIKMKPDSAGNPAPVYVFSGEDGLLLTQQAKSLVNRLVPESQQTLGLEIIEAQARTAGEAGAALARAIESLRTIAFLSARQVVWLRGANFLDRGMLARARETAEMLAALAALIEAGLPPGNTLVITTNAVDKAAGFFKACQARGEIYQQEELKPAQKERAALGFARELLRKNGLQASPAAISAIVELAGTDSRQLTQEIGKLAAFLYPRPTAGEDDVGAIISSTRQNEAMHLTDAVATRNLPKAIAILRQLLFQKENPIGLLAALEARFRYLFILNAMRGEKDETITAFLAADKGRPLHPYFLGRLKEQARGFAPQELARGREAILETRLKLVSTSAELEALLLEKLLVKLCHRPGRLKNQCFAQ